MDTRDYKTYDVVVRGGQDDHTTYVRHYTLQQTMWMNLQNHFTACGSWVARDEDLKDCDANFLGIRRYPDEDLNRKLEERRRRIRGMRVDNVLLQKGLQNWVSQQSLPGRFLCSVCGRSSIVDITATPGMASHGRGVCMCCINMPGFPYQGLQDHPANDMFYIFACKELAVLFPELEFSANLDRTVSMSSRDYRPDLTIYVNRGTKLLAIFVETDPGCKSDAEIGDKDRHLLGMEQYRGPTDDVHQRALLRVNTEIMLSCNYNNNVFLLVWLVLHQIVRDFDVRMRGNAAGIVAKTRAHDNRIFINYPSYGSYTLLGMKIYGDNDAEMQRFRHLMQVGYERTGRAFHTTAAAFPTYRELLYETISDPQTNPYVVVYHEYVPRIVHIAEEDVEAVLKARDRVDVKVHPFDGLYMQNQRPVNTDTRSLLFGKLLLVRIILYNKLRWYSRSSARFDRTRANREGFERRQQGIS
eukprot:335694-Hanusia_phi.AAC.12